MLSTLALRTHGMSRADLHRALDDGTLVRVRRGWYATSTAPPAIVVAAKIGGRLTGLAALKLHGAWTLTTPPIDVRVADGVSIVRVPGSTVHWTSERVTPGIDSPSEALEVAIVCADLRAVVIAVDSLVNRRILSESEARAVLNASARGRRALTLHDPAAESGIETLVRLALRRLRIRLRSQAVIVGVGRVDFLIGQRLVIEADGYEWHADSARFEADRERDRELVRRGYVVIRASYKQVTTNLDAVTETVLAVIRRREHLWRPIHRAQLSELGRLIDVSDAAARDSES